MLHSLVLLVISVMRRRAVRTRFVLRSRVAARGARAYVAAKQERLRVRQQQLREEVASAVTHGAGLLLAVAGVPVLIVLGALRGSALHVTTYAVYGGSLVACYAASTLYHASQRPRLKHVLRIIDHAAIYLLIAGTYTPFVLLNLERPWSIVLLALVWAIALGGCVFKLFCVDRYEGFSTALYLLMGWLAVIAIKPFMAAVPLPALLWLLAGGLFYTGGVVFFLWERLPYNHAIWHLFVIAGSACHYVAILRYAW